MNGIPPGARAGARPAGPQVRGRPARVRAPRLRPTILCAAALLLAAPIAFAENALRVSRDQVTIDEDVEVIVTLEGEFASVDDLELPLESLKLIGGPSVSSEMQWVNGKTSRRKSFRWRVSPTGPGTASAGPVVVKGSDGGHLTLPRVTIQIVADETFESIDPSVVAAAVARAGRDRLFLLPEVSKTTAWLGEQVVVTWYIYTAEPVRDLRISSKARLDGFWSEEIPVEKIPRRTVMLAGREYRKIAVRRVAVYPLAAGTHEVGGFEAIAEVVEPVRDPFGGWFQFQQSITRIRRRAPEVAIQVKDLPEGVSAGLVGEASLTCAAPVVSQVGPVSIDIMVSGTGNLRGAEPPRIAGEVAGLSEFEELGVIVRPGDGRLVAMQRRWKLLLYPRQEGTFAIPPLELNVFDPATAVVRTERCEATNVLAHAVKKAGSGNESAGVVSPGVKPDRAAGTGFKDKVLGWPWKGTLGAVLLMGIVAFAGGFAFRAARARGRLRSLARQLIGDGDPGTMRRRLVEESIRRRIDPEALFVEATDRGDAWRAILSALAIREKERLTAAAEATADLEARVIRWLEETERAAG